MCVCVCVCVCACVCVCILSKDHQRKTLSCEFYPSLMGRVFAIAQEDWGSNPCRVIPKSKKMALDTSLLNTQHYKVRIKGEVEQSRERRYALCYISV